MHTIKAGRCICGTKIGYKDDLCLNCTKEVMLQIEDDMREEDLMSKRWDKYERR